jgi:hypothetical protein
MPVSVAILCSGESLKRFLDHPRDHDVYIGVNRMAEDYPCDWWVFADGAAFEWYTPEVRAGRPPMVCTSQAIRDRLGRSEKVSADKINAHAWLMMEELHTSCPNDPGWKNFSMTVALVLAESLGATSITIYGCDWKGHLDYDGTKPPRGGRNQYRWNNEKHKTSHICLWLARQGVAVRRLLVDENYEEMNTVSKKTKDEAVETTADEQPQPDVIGEASQPQAEPAQPAVSRHTMKLTRDFKFGTEELPLPVGTAVAEIKLHPPFTLGFLSRGMEDGLIKQRN